MAEPSETEMPEQPSPEPWHGAVVVLPTFNERENLPPLVGSLLAQPGLAVVIVDDDSPDGTGAVADRLSAEQPNRVWVIHRSEKAGLGTAYLAGFRRALDLGAEWILTMDADHSHDPETIPEILRAARSGGEVVIGSRYVHGGSTPDFPLRRKILSGLANLTAHLLGGLEAHDATSGFRCYHRKVLLGLPLQTIRSSGYSFLIELLFLSQAAGFHIAEVPIVFRDRTRGVSKISRAEIWKAVRTVVRLGWRRLGRSAEPAGLKRASLADGDDL